MKKKVIKQIQQIIDDKFQTNWEFIINEIIPNFEEDEININEVSTMIGLEIYKRRHEALKN